MLLDRMIRAARLDSSLYDEVERDTTATTQALQVALLVAVAWGIGNVVGVLPNGIPGEVVRDLLIGVVGGVVGWIGWSLITFWIGTTLMGGTATPGELLRTLGFAYLPNLLSIFKFIAFVGPLLGLVAVLWSLVAGVIAIRQALDFGTGRAVITVVLGWIGMFVVVLVLGLVFGLLLSF